MPAYVLWTNASLKVAVFGQRRLEKNRSGMICFRAQLCGNYGKILQIQTSKPTVGTNVDIFIAVSTKSLQSFKSTFFLLLITYVAKRCFGRNARNKSFFMQECYIELSKH